MGFTRSTTTTNVHSTLGDYPNVDDGISASDLKARFDSPATGLKTDLNGLMTELEANTASNNLGAGSIGDGDTSSATIQAKLNKIYAELLAIKGGGLDAGSIETADIADNAVTTGKINSKAVTTAKIDDSAVTEGKINNGAVTTNKLGTGAVTSEKLATNAKKAENLTATAMTESDTSDGNIQAKLNKLAQDMIDITQGAVADNSITTAKMVDSAVTTAKINDGAVTTGKVADGAITSAKIASGLGLVPQGTICMWSGAVNAIPTGWVLCNGSNGTPDLRNRFIVGAGSTYSVGNTGGEASHKLVVSEMPSHSHTIGSTEVSGSFVKGTESIAASGEYIPFATGGYRVSTRGAYRTKTLSMGSHSHDCSASGSGVAHENRPPYYALAYIMKT